MHSCLPEPRWRKMLYAIARWAVILFRIPWYPLRAWTRARRCRRGEHWGIFGTCEWCGAEVPCDVRLPLVRRVWPSLYFSEIVPIMSIAPTLPPETAAAIAAQREDRWEIYDSSYTWSPPPDPPAWRKILNRARATLLRWAR